jgi:hypothetical protein
MVDVSIGRLRLSHGRMTKGAGVKVAAKNYPPIGFLGVEINLLAQ